jgi:beta-barrel assembly-enhancing protease
VNPQQVSSANRQFLLWSLAVVLFIGWSLYAVWAWGLPWVATAATRLVPVSWEQNFGSSVAASIAPDAKPCLAQISRRLQDALPSPSPYRFEIRCAASPDVNALAAPGGYIVVFQGLLDAVSSEEQIAAVLAHEMQHVLHRHSTRSIFRAFAIQAIAGLVFGDVTSLIAQVSGSLGALHYLRSDEEQADRDGVILLKRAGIDPMAMPEMLESLDRAIRDNPQLPSLLSSHPDTLRRISATRELARSVE